MTNVKLSKCEHQTIAVARVGEQLVRRPPTITRSAALGVNGHGPIRSLARSHALLVNTGASGLARRTVRNTRGSAPVLSTNVPSFTCEVSGPRAAVKASPRSMCEAPRSPPPWPVGECPDEHSPKGPQPQKCPDRQDPIALTATRSVGHHPWQHGNTNHAHVECGAWWT